MTPLNLPIILTRGSIGLTGTTLPTDPAIAALGLVLIETDMGLYYVYERDIITNFSHDIVPSLLDWQRRGREEMLRHTQQHRFLNIKHLAAVAEYKQMLEDALVESATIDKG